MNDKRNKLISVQDQKGNELNEYIYNSSHADLRRFSQDIFDSRMDRAKYFEGGYFGEVGWNVMLLLFSRQDGADYKSICEAVGPSCDVSEQWVDRLQAAGYIEVMYQKVYELNLPAMLKLTPIGYIKMRRYLSSCVSNWMGNI